jgi:hypothetical protein
VYRQDVGMLETCRGLDLAESARDQPLRPTQRARPSELQADRGGGPALGTLWPSHGAQARAQSGSGRRGWPEVGRRLLPRPCSCEGMANDIAE